MAQATDAVWLPVLPDMSGFGPGIVKGAGSQVDSSGKAVGKRFGAAVLAGTAVIAGGAALATKSLYNIGATFDEVRDTIRVGTGATGDDLAALEQSAKNIGRNVPAEFEAIGTAVADLNTRLGLTGPTLETVASQILELERMGQAVDINTLSGALNAFNIEAEQTPEIMDHLFRVSQATGISVNDLAAQAMNAAPAVMQLGFSFEETTGLIGNLDKAGLNSNRMMMGMSQALVRLAKDGEEPADAFRRTIGEIEGFLEAGDRAAAIDLAGQVFGTRNATQFIGALESGTLAMDDLATVAGMTEDTILGAGEETMDFAEQWQMFKNNILVTLEPVASRVFGFISDAMGEITDGVKAFTAAWQHNDGEVTSSGIPGFMERVGYWARQAFDYLQPKVEQVAAFFTDSFVPAIQSVVGWLIENKDVVIALGAGIGAAMVALGTYNAVVKVTEAATKAWNAIQRVLNGTLRANPIGIIITIIGLLVGAIVLAYQRSETFRNIVQAAWNGIKTAASVAWDIIGAVFNWIVDGLGRVGQWFSDRGRDITGAWNTMKEGLRAGWTWINERVFQPFRDGLDRLVGWVRDGKDRITDLWESVKSAFATPINWVIRNAWNNGLLRAINAVARVIPGVSEISPLPEIRTRAKGGYTPPGWTLVGEEGPELVNFTQPGRVYTAAETRAMLAGQAPNPMVNQFTPSNPPHGGIGGWFSDRWEDVKSAGRWVADGVRDAAGNVVKWARGGLAKAAEIVLNPIRSLIQQTIGGGEGFLSDLLSGAGTFAIDKLLGWLREEDEGAAPDAGGRQLRGAQPHVNNAAYALADMVGGIRMMQAFNQSMAGGHPRGLAVDFIDSVSKLNRLADAIVRTGGFDNFNYMAWQARLWSPGRGWRPQGRGFGNDPFHRWHLHAEWYDQGGILHPGLSMVANGTGRPEAVLTAPQWNTLATLAGQARMLPDTMYLRDYNGELVARMRVEARDTIRSEVEPLQREQRQQIGV